MAARLRVVLASSAALAIALWSSGAAAQSGQPRGDPEWDPAWPTVGPMEITATAVTGAASIGVYLFVNPQRQPHWTGGILVDDAVRDALRERTAAGLRTAATLSTAGAIAEIAIVGGIDSLAVPLARGSPKVALELALMDAEAFAVSTLLTTSMFDVIGRARPYYADCQRDQSSDPNCRSGGEFTSFPSGHVNEPFTAAGLSCAHHMWLRLYGGGWADTLACGRDLTLATAVGVLRMMADRHYLSDVLAGAAIGFGFGYGVPVLLHYGLGRRASRVTVTPMGGADRFGLIAAGDW